MAGDVAGTIIDDLNNNGMLDDGEDGIQGWTVFVDVDRNGELNGDEPFSVTNKDGDYLIPDVPAGMQNIREILPLGWSPSVGSADNQDVLVVDGKEAIADFFSFKQHVGSIVGTVWQDLNGDGIRETDPSTGEFTDPSLADWTIYLDLNNNEALDTDEPNTLTDANGQYTFIDLAPGDYELIEVLPSGWDVPPTFDVKQTVTVFDGVVSTARDFANVSNLNGSIQGLVWNDLNGDGVRAMDPTTGEYTEPGLAGWTIFLDSDGNETLDAGEPTTTSGVSGYYTFTGLIAGDYEVTQVLPEGWNPSPGFDVQQTVGVSGGTLSIADDFANFGISNGSMRGLIWNDLNADGVRAVDPVSGLYSEPGLSGWTVYIDSNDNGAREATEPTATTDADGAYVFADLEVGEYQVVEVLPANWEPSDTYSDNYSVKVYGGTESIAPDFANYLTTSSLPGSVSGFIWSDLDGDGVRDASSGDFSDPGLAGWTVYVDLDSDRTLDAAEPQAISSVDGSYTISNVTPGTISVVLQQTPGWRPSSPTTNVRTLLLRSNQEVAGNDFGLSRVKDSSIQGTIFADTNRNGVRDADEGGLDGITVFLDTDNDGFLDAGEPNTTTSVDQFYTPTVDEAGKYSFTHLEGGTYVVRAVLPETLSATPASQAEHGVAIGDAEERTGVDTAAVFRDSEIHGIVFEDANANHVQDVDEAGISGRTIYVDLDRDDLRDDDEPFTVTGDDGSYLFVGLGAGAYVVREVETPEYAHTYPQTTDGTLWPDGVSNLAVGDVTPASITVSLAEGETSSQRISITLPDTGALTNLVDVFLLFDDTGSFTSNSPIVRAAFPTIMSALQASLPGINLGFGVGRLEEYANFAAEYSSGRPFVLNQPIVAANTPLYQEAIQAALNRVAPGYGGDQPETDIEALYQLVTGLGFDGNDNGSVLDSGVAGLASTQVSPGASGDVPSFASFQPDSANMVLAPSGTIGGAGFRSGALPIILLATDTGFAYQPHGESVIVGAGGMTLPINRLTQTSRATTPFNSGAGLQETITGLNALGALVIGLGTNPQATLDPRQGLEALSLLTGAVNNSATTIANGTTDPIAPGDPLYFQISSGFASSVANGVVSAIQNAVTNVAVEMTVQASDPRVRIINHTGVISAIGSGETATFDIEIVGDGVPHRFDLQFVRAGTNVVMGSIPVVIGTPIPGDGYEFCEVEEGEYEIEIDFGDRSIDVVPNVAPTFVAAGDQIAAEDSGVQTVVGWATAISPGAPSESGQVLNFIVQNDNPSLFSVAPAISPDGSLTFTPALDAHGVATLTARLHDDGGTAGGGADTSDPVVFTIAVTSVNDAPVATDDSYGTDEGIAINGALPGVLNNDSDSDGDALLVSLVSGPSHGVLHLNANGSFDYTPEAGFHGVDSFTYRASDGAVDSNEATVTITVNDVNFTPVATDDSYETDEGIAINVVLPGVLTNDSDSDGDALLASLMSGPNHGVLHLNADGSFNYTPEAGFHGVDSFTYRVSDGAADSNEATVTITVNDVNFAPVAVGESYSVVQDAILTVPTVGVLGNDTDADGDSLAALQVAGPAHGTLSLAADGSFVYTPAAGFNGSDSFTYVASDGTLDSNVATVSIVVEPAIANGTSFFVINGSSRGLFGYDADGAVASRDLLSKENHKSRGLASDAAGTTLWDIDEKGDIFVYGSNGTLLGKWEAKGLDDPEGIATDGVNIWIVDGDHDRVLFFAGAAARRSGYAKPTSSFRLRPGNRDPKDIVTDGAHLWIVNDTKADDRVFRYTVGGQFEGSWTIDPANSTPTGLTLDPSNPADVWIVDAKSDRIYQYTDAADRLQGEQLSASSLRLAPGNGNPQGITLRSPTAAATVDAAYAYSSTKSTTRSGTDHVSNTIDHLARYAATSSANEWKAFDEVFERFGELDDLFDHMSASR